MLCALLAEDDPTSRAFLQEALTLLGWRLESHADGTAAALAATHRRFDALLLDLNLPDLDGLELLRRIRNHDGNASADAPAVLITADPDPTLHQRMRRQGFDAVLTKPMSIAQLHTTLASLGLALESTAAESITGATAAAPAQAELPIWDDAGALRTIGGRREHLDLLRGMLLAELPAQREQILTAPDGEPARTIRHRLRAACGFCGTPRLARALACFDADPSPPGQARACAELAAAVDELLATPPG